MIKIGKNTQSSREGSHKVSEGRVTSKKKKLIMEIHQTAGNGHIKLQLEFTGMECTGGRWVAVVLK